MPESPPSISAPPCLFSQLRHRTFVRPTRRGCLALLLCALLGVVAVWRGLYGFLAVQDPVPGGVLVMEGWVGDADLALAEAEFRRGGYRVWCVTGEPLEKGSPLLAYQDYANLTVATYTKLGGEAGLLQPVAWKTVPRDRTYASALALKAWLRERGHSAEKITIVTSGVHARRSRLLYEMAFGPGSRIGVFATPERNFDPDRWWTSSMGVRAVVGETLAYLYARCLFSGK
jgi:hypothetical protein